MLGTVAFLALSLFQAAPRVQDFDGKLNRAQGDPAYAATLATEVQKWFGDGLKMGDRTQTRDLHVAWAVEATSTPVMVADDGSLRLPLRPIGTGGIYGAAAKLKDGDGFRWHYEVGGKPLGGGVVEVYEDDPDTKARVGVPKGTLTEMPMWQSKIFDGTTRHWWVYRPAMAKRDTPLAVMVFQDGQGMKNYVPQTLDNLIAKGDIPPMVGIFLEPGAFADKRSNRSFEYDTLSDQYARFLLEEILPEVGKIQTLRSDAASRATCGLSSGGICAFTVAWQRPNEFGKVLSWIGSFVNLAGGKTGFEGGHNYPPMIRKFDPKPIRVYLQDGLNDLDNPFGNWPLANQEMARALAYRGYDYKLVLGKGPHSDRMGRARLPEMLRWLWRP